MLNSHSPRKIIHRSTHFKKRLNYIEQFMRYVKRTLHAHINYRILKVIFFPVIEPNAFWHIQLCSIRFSSSLISFVAHCKTITLHDFKTKSITVVWMNSKVHVIIFLGMVKNISQHHWHVLMGYSLEQTVNNNYKLAITAQCMSMSISIL